MLVLSILSPPSVDVIIFLECCKEMGDVIFVDVFDSGVIDDKGEADGTPIVRPETWSELALMVSCDH